MRADSMSGPRWRAASQSRPPMPSITLAGSPQDQRGGTPSGRCSHYAATSASQTTSTLGYASVPALGSLRC